MKLQMNDFTSNEWFYVLKCELSDSFFKYEIVR